MSAFFSSLEYRHRRVWREEDHWLVLTGFHIFRKGLQDSQWSGENFPPVARGGWAFQSDSLDFAREGHEPSKKIREAHFDQL